MVFCAHRRTTEWEGEVVTSLPWGCFASPRLTNERKGGRSSHLCCGGFREPALDQRDGRGDSPWCFAVSSAVSPPCPRCVPAVSPSSPVKPRIRHPDCRRGRLPRSRSRFPHSPYVRPGGWGFPRRTGWLFTVGNGTLFASFAKNTAAQQGTGLFFCDMFIFLRTAIDASVRVDGKRRVSKETPAHGQCETHCPVRKKKSESGNRRNS